MKIQCILERKGGSHIDLGSLMYHFEPLEDGAHVAEVEDENHIDRFLSIAEAFRVYHGKGTPKGKPEPTGKPDATVTPQAPAESERLRLYGSSAHPPSFDVAGKTYTQFEIVKIAFAASNMTEDEWNELSEDDRSARIDMALDDLDSAAASNEAGDAETETQETEAKGSVAKGKSKKAA